MSAWLVTGASGFLGRHLVEILQTERRNGTRILTCGRRPPPGATTDNFLSVDLSRPAEVRHLLEQTRPEVLFHLAGKTPPGTRDDFYLGNTLQTVLLLETLRVLNHPTRVVLAGSAAELGLVPESDLPVEEDYPCRPTNAYGKSKWLATLAALSTQPPLEVMVARVFNPIGPGIPVTQALGSFASRLSNPETTCLKVGDLSVRRDFIDVRDVARALIALAERGRGSLVYHVGTGRSQSVGEGLEYLIARAGRPIEVISQGDPTPEFRLSDSRADIRRIREHTGWQPEIPWEQSLSDLWKGVVAANGCH